VPRAAVDTADKVALGAELADETGIRSVSLAAHVERLRDKAPAVSKHLDRIGDRPHCMATVAIADLRDAVRDALEGRSGADATKARPTALANDTAEHPGRS
jgi:hypothetical protein